MLHFCFCTTAARALAVPDHVLYNALQAKGFLRSDGRIEFERAAAAVGCPGEIATAVRAGKEWLMTYEDINKTWGHLYDHDPVHAFNRIAGSMAFSIGGITVYQVTPFIAFAKLTQEERFRFLEGIQRGYSRQERKNLPGSKVRRQVSVPSQNRSPRRIRRTTSK